MKLNYDEPLSNVAFNFNLRRYAVGLLANTCDAGDKLAGYLRLVDAQAAPGLEAGAYTRPLFGST